MSDISQNLNKTRYTHRDYESIKQDLINAIPSLTQEWTCREDSDPGIVLIKLLSMFGDTLSYNVDKIALELYLQTVTQRKNCAMILNLLGYKMHWYRSARVVASVSLIDEGDATNPNRVILNPFTTTFKGGQTVYTVVPSEDNQGSIDINSKVPERVYLVEGTSSEIKFKRTNLVNNRFYFTEDNIDETNLWLNFGGFHTCKLVDNLDLVADSSVVSFEFNVDEYDKPYIELISYWEDIIGSLAMSESFSLRYIRSSGSEGSVSRGQLSQVLGTGRGSIGPSSNLLVVHQSNNNREIESDDGWTVPGYSPQSVDDARKDACNFITTYETLVTSSDFERASRRVVGVTASKLVDNEVIRNENLDAEEVSSRAKDKFVLQDYTDEISQETSKLLLPYLAVVYLTYLDLGPENNYYCSLSDSDPYKFSSYDDFVGDNSKVISEELKSLGCFPYRATNNLLMSVNEVYQYCKMLNVKIEFGTTKVYPFKVAGTLSLVEPLSPSETLSIVEDINKALENYYYPDNHKYGEQPKFLDIVRVIQNANDKISYFDAIGQITQFNPPCNGLEGFDATSFAVYTGLSTDFNLDLKFLKFRIKNTSSSEISLTSLNKVSGKTYIINGKNFLNISLTNIKELRALCEDLKSNSSLSYAK